MAVQYGDWDVYAPVPKPVRPAHIMVASRAYPTIKITSPNSIRIAVDCGHFMLFSFALDREVLHRESRMLEVGEHGHDHAVITR